MNLTSLSRASMRTSVPMLVTPADVFTSGGVRQSTPQSAVIVTTPPVFAGITGVTPKTDGAINVQWAAATSTNTPHEYQIYVAHGIVNAATLFAMSPATLAYDSVTNIDVMKLSDNTTYLVNGETYTFGVRCRDRLGNQNINLVVMTAVAISSGNIATIYQTIADSLINTNSNLMDRNNEFSDRNQELILRVEDFTNLNTDYGDLNTQHQSNNSDQATNNTNQANNNNAHASNNTDQATNNTTFEADLLVMQSRLTDFGTSNTTYDGLLTSMASENSDFASSNAALTSEITSLDNSISDLNGQIATLQAISTGIAGSGGLSMSIEAASFVLTAQQEGVL